ncbi:nucleotide disphospho-sugar-binding domain-containing protein [Streptomyces cyaneofuscatus]|uniref:nucleotide disphospho-sugar-binding domain-containing protein n=1 Tax=Streptomyces cyaneofuscatus TaxID=66883 RepID=UPI0034035763
MRVLFTVSDWTTNWFSLVPLGWALRSAGHDVRVACAPSQAEPVSRAGLLPVPVLVGTDLAVTARVHNCREAAAGRWPFPELPPHPDTGRPLTAPDAFDAAVWYRENIDRMAGDARRSTDGAVAFARWWRPHLVVHDLMSLEGPLVGRVLNVPALLHLWGPLGPEDPVPGVPQDEANKSTFLPVDLSGAFARYGVGEIGPEVYEHVVDPCPTAVAPPLRGERLPVRHVVYNGPGPMPAWLMEPSEKPRVCVVWGTSVSTMFGESSFPVPRIAEALEGLDADVVFALTGADRRRAGTLPRDMRLLESRVPLHLLLTGADLAVHHAGGGCTMTALAAGTAQLTLPPGHDQEVIAPRLTAAGVGEHLHDAKAGPEAIRSAVRRLLGDPGPLAMARELAQEMADRPSPAALVSSLERRVEGGGRALLPPARSTRPTTTPLEVIT